MKKQCPNYGVEDWIRVLGLTQKSRTSISLYTNETRKSISKLRMIIRGWEGRGGGVALIEKLYYNFSIKAPPPPPPPRSKFPKC
jgi:hypothetical protein